MTSPDPETPKPTAPDGDAESSRPSNAASWATPVDRLTLDRDMPDPGMANNITGRKVTSPIQGFGRMWHKTHRISLDGVDITPKELIGQWKANFGSFWPKQNRFYGPLTGLEPGEIAVLNIGIPGRQRLSTGVLVLYADDESFTLMTPQGHIFAGWITFSSFREEGVTIAQVEILMRASDPMYEIGMELLGHKQENAFWEATLRNVAAHCGLDRVATTEVECIDSRYQWKQAGNIWHNSAIRTRLYTVTSPFLKLARRLRN